MFFLRKRTGSFSDHMIQEFFLPTHKQMEVGNVWFQQDGAMANTARVGNCFAATLPRTPHLLEGRSAVASTTTSFSTMPLFFKGLSEITCLQPTSSDPALKNNIRQAVATIPVDLLERVERSLRVRLMQCIENNGHHLSDIISKTQKA